MTPPELPVRCPRCTVQDTVPVVLGMPDADLMAAAARGEVVLGGCVVSSTTPTRHCRSCGWQWRDDVG